MRALRIDPRTVVPAGSPGHDRGHAHHRHVRRAAHRGDGEGRAARVVRERRLPRRHERSPRPTRRRSRDGVSLASPAAATARAAVGVQDEDGMLDWVELLAGRDAERDDGEARWTRSSPAPGARSRMLVTGDSRALLGGTLDLAAQPFAAAVGATAARLVRGAAPGRPPRLRSPPSSLRRSGSRSRPSASATSGAQRPRRRPSPASGPRRVPLCRHGRALPAEPAAPASSPTSNPAPRLRNLRAPTPRHSPPSCFHPRLACPLHSAPLPRTH